jgi:hypothetical protein
MNIKIMKLVITLKPTLNLISRAKLDFKTEKLIKLFQNMSTVDYFGSLFYVPIGERVLLC